MRGAAASVAGRAAVLAGAAVLGAAAPVAAHGVGGRTDLPVPAWQVAWAAACAVGLSFVAVGWLWRKPRLRAASSGKPLPPAAQRLGRVMAPPARVVGLAVFAVVVFAALRGNVNPSVNIAPAALYIVFWVGLPMLSVLVGDVWRAFNPIPALAGAVDRLTGRIRADRLTGRIRADRSTGRIRADRSTVRAAGRRTARAGAGPRPGDKRTAQSRGTSAGGHHWWGAAALAGFAWLELAYFDSGSPRAIGVFLVAYTAVMVLGAAAQGEGWARRADGFGVLFGSFGAMGPLGRDYRGRLRRRWPLAGLASLPVLPGTAALVLVALGSTSFDGFTRSSIWLDVISNRRGWELTMVNTAGLVLVIGVVFVIYRAAIAVMALITGERERELADVFVPSLLPIVVAYIVAHYFSYVVFEGQSVLAHASDPFGRGWDIFGTATRQIDYTIISVDAIAWVQTAAIVVGHILAVIVAHDRAVDRYPSHLALRSQYPMLIAMIAYTIIGLLLLLGT